MTKTATPGTVPGKENEMSEKSKIFEEYYEDYCRQISGIDFDSAKEILEIEGDGDRLVIPFFDRKYTFSGNEILDPSGKRPHYMVCVILAKYLLLCPDLPHDGKEWVSFKDFKEASHFLNVNFFASDTERAIVKFFSGKKDMLLRACEELGGVNREGEFPYDLAMEFNALPRFSLLLLFNDADEEFSAKCTVLFQSRAEFYLDPESLAMTGSYLAKLLQGVEL